MTEACAHPRLDVLRGYQTLGRYEVLGKIASGGMGEIHLARLTGQAGFAKLVVLKRLLPELAPTGEMVQMFLDEARLAARLSHPNVCEVHDLGVEDGQYYIVMQYLDGVPFSRVMVPGEGADEREHARLVASLVAQACEGLHHAHELRGDDGRPLNVVHRDVSPSNLFVTVDGVCKVLDFGIAKARGQTSVTEKGMLKGKFAYMSPEQIAEGPLDRRSDIFCVGILLHEALSGKRLFRRDSPGLAARAILDEPIPDLPESTPPELAAVVMRALSRDPTARHQTARELGQALTRAITPLTPAEIATIIKKRFSSDLEKSQATLRATEQTPPTRALAPRPKTRSRLPVYLGAATLAALAAVLLWGPFTRKAATSARADAAPAPDRAPAPAPASTPASAPAPERAPESEPRPKPAPRPPDGFVSIDSTPFATIYLGKRRLGDTPLIKHPLPAGRHTLRAVLSDGRSKTIAVTVPPDATAPPINLTW